ncbi:MAG: heavy metal translocating P-type ATPase [Oscillospiraceae bacterium]
MKEEFYSIGGMHCASCSSAVERVTRRIKGVERCDVNLPMNRMDIVYDDSAVTPEDIISAVDRAGFSAQPLEKNGKAAPKSTEEDEGTLKTQRYRLIIAAVFSILLLYLSMGTMLFSGLPLPEFLSMSRHPQNFALMQALLTIPVLFCGRELFVSGFRSLFHGFPNMDALVALSCTASFLYSIVTCFMLDRDMHLVHNLYFESAAIVITLILVGKFIEENSKKKTKSAITKLMQLSPDTAILVRDGGQWEVPTEILKPGDIVLVKPGTRIPLDGAVTEGVGSVDESMLTGESLPLEKTVGSLVIGGSINVSGALFVEITRVGEDTTLAKIIKFVEDAQGKKAPISKIADKVAGFFVPLVMVIAVVAAAIWLFAGQDFAFALKIFTSVLVIACPCAMGLATPTAIIVGTGLGASKGILIRSGEALEITHKTDVVVLDKTGTVTKGKPRVTEIIPLEMTEAELLTLACAAETLSDHPLAKAIAKEAAEREISVFPPVSSFENLNGLGVKAILTGGDALIIGNSRLMAEEGIDTTALASELERLSGEGQTPMTVARGGKLAGVISVGDTVRESSRGAIEKLKSLDIETILLSGDNSAAAAHIGKQVGVDRVIAEVLPGDKAAVVSKLQSEGKTVMMVGDGINDAPALAQADVGCAIGNGSDIAIESADIVLMKSDLDDVARAIRLSRLTITNIKQNLFWAFCYNTLGIPIAAGLLFPAFHLLLNPMLGALAMSLSSICVVSNALRLKTKKI